MLVVPPRRIVVAAVAIAAALVPTPRQEPSTGGAAANAIPQLITQLKSGKAAYKARRAIVERGSVAVAPLLAELDAKLEQGTRRFVLSTLTLLGPEAAAAAGSLAVRYDAQGTNLACLRAAVSLALYGSHEPCH